MTIILPTYFKSNYNPIFTLLGLCTWNFEFHLAYILYRLTGFFFEKKKNKPTLSQFEIIIENWLVRKKKCSVNKVDKNKKHQHIFIPLSLLFMWLTLFYCNQKKSKWLIYKEREGQRCSATMNNIVTFLINIIKS